MPIRSHAAGPSSNSSHLATNSSLPSIVNIRWNNVSFSVVIVNKHLSTYIDEKKKAPIVLNVFFFFLFLLKCLPQKSVYGLLRIDLNKYRSGPIIEDMMIFFPDCSSCNIKNRQCLFSLFFFKSKANAVPLPSRNTEEAAFTTRSKLLRALISRE